MRKKCVPGFLFHVPGFLFGRYGFSVPAFHVPRFLSQCSGFSVPAFRIQSFQVMGFSRAQVLLLPVSSAFPSCELRKFEACHLICELGFHTRVCLTWQHHSFSYTSALCQTNILSRHIKYYYNCTAIYVMQDIHVYAVTATRPTARS